MGLFSKKFLERGVGLSPTIVPAGCGGRAPVACPLLARARNYQNESLKFILSYVKMLIY